MKKLLLSILSTAFFSTEAMKDNDFIGSFRYRRPPVVRIHETYPIGSFRDSLLGRSMRNLTSTSESDEEGETDITPPLILVTEMPFLELPQSFQMFPRAYSLTSIRNNIYRMVPAVQIFEKTEQNEFLDDDDEDMSFDPKWENFLNLFDITFSNYKKKEQSYLDVVRKKAGIKKGEFQSLIESSVLPFLNLAERLNRLPEFNQSLFGTRIVGWRKLLWDVLSQTSRSRKKRVMFAEQLLSYIHEDTIITPQQYSNSHGKKLDPWFISNRHLCNNFYRVSVKDIMRMGENGLVFFSGLGKISNWNMVKAWAEGVPNDLRNMQIISTAFDKNLKGGHFIIETMFLEQAPENAKEKIFQLSELLFDLNSLMLLQAPPESTENLSIIDIMSNYMLPLSDDQLEERSPKKVNHSSPKKSVNQKKKRREKNTEKARRKKEEMESGSSSGEEIPILV